MLLDACLAFIFIPPPRFPRFPKPPRFPGLPPNIENKLPKFNPPPRFCPADCPFDCPLFCPVRLPNKLDKLAPDKLNEVVPEFMIRGPLDGGLLLKLVG